MEDAWNASSTTLQRHAGMNLIAIWNNSKIASVYASDALNLSPAARFASITMVISQTDSASWH
jgi:hypothetical protein